MLGIVEFCEWLAGAAALGVVASYVTQLLKALIPSIKDKSAVVASVLVAALVNVAANLVRPYLSDLPPGAAQMWPVVVWAVSQLWYALIMQKQ